MSTSAMKIIFLTLIIASMSVSAKPVVKMWTLNELSDAIGNPLDANEKNPEKKPLIDALNLIMNALMSGKEDNLYGLILSPTGLKLWTKNQLITVLNDTNTNLDLVPYVAEAYQFLMNQNSKVDDKKKDTTEVRAPAMDISTWTPDDILTALNDPQTNQGLISYLKNAQKEFEEAKDKGQKKEKVYLVTPIGLIPPAMGGGIIYLSTFVQKSNTDEYKNLVK